MARKYDHEYKVQAAKLAKEIGGAKAAKELGIPEGTIHTWLKAVRAGKLDIGEGSQTPASAMSLSEEITMLRKRVKEQDKEIRRLKEENEFLEEASAFSPPAVGSQQKPENDISGFENRGRQDYRKNLILLPDAWYQPARFL
ncbi:MAG: transposase [Lacrimispora saccharolytica]